MKAKNMKSKITNKLWLLSGFIFLFTLVSCSNLLTKDLEQASDGKTYLVINSDNVSINSRTISPTAEYVQDNLTGIYLYAKKIKDGNGNSVSLTEKTLAGGTALKLSDLYRKVLVLEDGGGTYTIRMTAKLDDVYFYKQKDVEIEENQTNPITIELDPVKSSSELETSFGEYGGFSFTINANVGTANKDIDSIYVTLEHLGTNQIIDQRYINRQTRYPKLSNQTVYQHLAKNAESTEKDSNGRIPAGTYRLTLDFLALDQSLGKDILVNSFPYILNVEEGRNTYYEATFDLNQVYTIKYNANGGSLDLGSRMQTKFTSKHEVMLPRMQKDGFTFQGWYTTSTFETGTGPIEEVESGTTENKTFYAKFADSVIYVDPTTTNTINDGSEENPVKTLSAAIAKIKAIETTNQSDWLQWYIKVKGTITESLVVSVNSDGIGSFKAKGITFVGASDLKNGEPQDVIQGDGTNPVFTIATNTQIIFKNIKITGGKDSQGYDGAGIVMKSGSVVLIEDGTLITENTASTNGGGIAVFNNANLMLAGGKITGNTCGTDKHGNDIYCSDSGNISVCGNPVIDDLYMPNSVTLLDNMTAGASITITPADYVIPHYEDSEGGYIYKAQVIHVVEGSGISISDNSEYFHITPEVDGEGNTTTTEWIIDDEGCLNSYCTLSFSGEGTSSMSATKIPCKYFTAASELPSPERTGYLFNGWYYKETVPHYNPSNQTYTYTYKMTPIDYKEDYEDDSGDLVVDSDYTFIASDMTLYATWISNSDTIYINAGDSGVDYAYIDEESGAENTIKLGDGSATAPFKSIKCALNSIKKLNDSGNDYTITVSGLSSEWNIEIGEDLPINSLTLQGKTGADTDGISLEGMPNEFSTLLHVTTPKPVTIQKMKVKLALENYNKDGVALNIGDSASVTLEDGVIFESSSSSLSSRGLIAVEDGGNLIMKTGAVIQDTQIQRGAVYVKAGGSFTMNGGSITNIRSDNSGGAVYVEGGEFTMNGGEISGNKTDAFNNGEGNGAGKSYGAGVCVTSGTFKMTGGYIRNNTAYIYTNYENLKTAGGGVFVYADGSFTMSGGEISGNSAINKKLDEEPTATMYAYGGGVCLQASGSKLASFTMTGGTISGNTAGTSGNGIGFFGSLDDGKTGTISLGADAIITDNDIYLPSNITITIVETMTGGLTPSIRATITPQEYAANQPILNDDGVSLEYEYDYFAVTPQSDGTITTNWFIDASGKLYKYSVGDLLLTDGTFVYYDENHTFSEDEVSAAVGLVYDLDEDGLPKGIIGLKNSMSYNGLTTWAPQYSTGYNIKFEEIICTPSDTGGNITFEGDTDGSDNWDYICEIDQAGSAYPATNYPAFNYALNYAETAGLTHSDYDSGWYMPSAAEMYDISMNLTTINSVLTKIKDINSASANTLSGYYFWTSSQADAAEVGNSAWYINITATSNPFTSSNKDWDSPSVCCIHKYEKQ